MSRIASCFAQLKQQNISALVPFITAGDPHPKYTVELMHTLVESGADIIELGVPFSDPMADGPVVQAADERALSHNVSLTNVLSLVQEFRIDDEETPVVLMGYLNPIEIMGYKTFAEQARLAGVDGVLVVDLPPEESEDLIEQTQKNEIDFIYLIAPNTDQQRIKLIASVASGYLYYVSLKGVTGANTIDTDSVESKLNEIRSLTDLPLGVGFGIKEGSTAKSVAKIADAVIVGSVLVNKIAASQNDVEQIKAGLTEVLSDMRQKMNES